MSDRGGEQLLETLWRERCSPDGERAYCPKCGRITRFSRYNTRQSRHSWTCRSCGRHIHPTAGTIFEKSSRPLEEWIVLLELLAEGERLSAKTVERLFGCNYKTARRMLALAKEYSSTPIFCGCGCGSLLSEHVRWFSVLSNQGLTPWRIGQLLGYAPSFVRRSIQNPPRFLRTHWFVTEEGQEARSRGIVASNEKQAQAAVLRKEERREVSAALRERKRAAKAARWWTDQIHPSRQAHLSLDEAVAVGKGHGGRGTELTRIEVVGFGGSAEDEAINNDEAARLRRIVGDLTPEDIQRMTAWDLERLQARLVSEGLRPESVQSVERARIRRSEDRHTGASVPKMRGHSGKRSRAEQKQVTRDHHVRELPNRSKQEHKQFRRARQDD